jgi:hypothetical protein
MKTLSFLTLTALLSLSACSHHRKSCCMKKEATTCTKEKCDKPCCDKEKKCADGSCKKDEKACAGESCKKS